MTNIRLLVLSLIVVSLGIFSVYEIFMVPKGIKKIDKDKFPITGIDISEGTGIVDFQMAKKLDVSFVIIHTSFGNNIDKNFEENYQNAIKAKLPVGLYHSFNFNVNWKIQCDKYLSAIKGKNVQLYYFLDVEDFTFPTFKSTDEKINNIQHFVNYFELQSGKKLMIYSNLDGYRKYLKSKFEKKTLWICSFSKNFKEPSGWVFWQHYQNGIFPYAKGCVDLNTFNGDLNDWNEFLRNK